MYKQNTNKKIFFPDAHKLSSKIDILMLTLGRITAWGGVAGGYGQQRHTVARPCGALLHTSPLKFDFDFKDFDFIVF